MKQRVMLGSGLRFDKWDGTIGISFSGGSGTVNDPYLISSCKEFAYFAKSVTDGNSYSGKYVSLISNLDLNDVEWSGIGYGTGVRNTASGNPFNGVFDGNFNVIRNINIKDTNNSHQGLFNYVRGGTIKNLVIENIYRIIKSYGEEGLYAYKGLFGYLVSGTIQNCIFKDLRYEISSSGIKGNALSENILSLVGQEFGNSTNFGNILNCFIYNISAKTNSNFILCGFGRYLGNEGKNGVGNSYVSGLISTNGEKEVYPVWHTWNNGCCYDCGLYLRTPPNGLRYLFCSAPFAIYSNNNVYDSSISGFINGTNEAKVGKTTFEFTNGVYVISDQYEPRVPSGNTRYYPQLKVFKNNKSRYVRELSEMSVKITV